jgi:nifR3 family TIM-barrel protein
MIKGFWKKLKADSSRARRGIFALAPMADVTDPAFRRIIAKYGKPDVMWTEFVSADGLALSPEEGKKKLLKDLEYSEGERPIVAQFFTSSPENMEKAGILAVELGFDGIDINMGCPDRSVEKQGAGAALIKNPLLARELIRSAKRGVESTGKYLPISVKTRIGYNRPEFDLETGGFLAALLEENLSAITIHARTRKEMSKVPARWEFVKYAVEIRNRSGQETLIIGNGDVMNKEEALNRIKETGADGVMFGRAIFGRPWLFSEKGEPTIRERLNILVEHTRLFEELLGDVKNFAIMKKHFKAYVSGFNGASELRIKLMEAKDSSEVETIIIRFLDNNYIL